MKVVPLFTLGVPVLGCFQYPQYKVQVDPIYKAKVDNLIQQLLYVNLEFFKNLQIFISRVAIYSKMTLKINFISYLCLVRFGKIWPILFELILLNKILSIN